MCAAFAPSQSEGFCSNLVSPVYFSPHLQIVSQVHSVSFDQPYLGNVGPSAAHKEVLFGVFIPFLVTHRVVTDISEQTRHPAVLEKKYYRSAAGRRDRCSWVHKCERKVYRKQFPWSKNRFKHQSKSLFLSVNVMIYRTE